MQELTSLDALHAHIVLDPDREQACGEFITRKMDRIRTLMTSFQNVKDELKETIALNNNTDRASEDLAEPDVEDGDSEANEANGANDAQNVAIEQAEEVRQDMGSQLKSREVSAVNVCEEGSRSPVEFEFISISGYDVIVEKPDLAEVKKLVPVPTLWELDSILDLREFRNTYVDYNVRMKRLGKVARPFVDADGLGRALVVESIQRVQVQLGREKVEKYAEDAAMLREIDACLETFRARIRDLHLTSYLQKRRRKCRHQKRKKESARSLKGARSKEKHLVLCRNCRKPGHLAKECIYLN